MVSVVHLRTGVAIYTIFLSFIKKYFINLYRHPKETFYDSVFEFL